MRSSRLSSTCPSDALGRLRKAHWRSANRRDRARSRNDSQPGARSPDSRPGGSDLASTGGCLAGGAGRTYNGVSRSFVPLAKAGQAMCRFHRKMVFVLALLAASVGTSAGSLIFPPKIRYNSFLVPKAGLEAPYSTKEDGTVSYAMEGLRIDVKCMTDSELNAFFPEESSKGKYSINPYTYGDYEDPSLGYTPNRFTVFRVSVHNYALAKVQLPPLKAILLTDRGLLLHSYGISADSPYESFERYYRARRGQSGNESYRFDMRMGIVRSHNYGEDEKIFKGENYSGFVVFDPLAPEAKQVRLVLKEFALKFGAFDKPIETLDVKFDFDRRIEKKVLPPERKGAGL